jgi:hypothetical protein
MSPDLVAALISGAGFLLSVSGSFFIAGSRWGEVKAKLAELERDKVTTGDVRAMGERLARIEGMFELKLRE